MAEIPNINERKASQVSEPYKIHTGEPDCDCGRCEPADPVVPMSAGALASGNPACEWPECAIMVDSCRWGDRRCFDDRRYQR